MIVQICLQIKCLQIYKIISANLSMEYWVKRLIFLEKAKVKHGKKKNSQELLHWYITGEKNHTTTMSSYNIFTSFIYRPSSWKEKKDNSPFSTQLFTQDLQYKARETNIILNSSAETRL